MAKTKKKKPALVQHSYTYCPASNVIAITVPVQIVSEANQSYGNIFAKAAKKQAQDRAWQLSYAASRKVDYPPPYLVTLIRLGPRTLDDDNLAGGFKRVRDRVAESLGVDDGDTSSVRWLYDQRKSKEYGAVVKIGPLARGNA